MILKFSRNAKDLEETKQLQKINKVGLTISNVKTYYKTKVIKTV